MRQPTLRSLRTHLRRYLRGRKTLWTLNALLFIICLSLLLDAHLDRSRSSSSSIRAVWDGKKDHTGTEQAGKNRAQPKPSRPEAVVKKETTPKPRSERPSAAEPVSPKTSKVADPPVLQVPTPQTIPETPRPQPVQIEPRPPSFCTPDEYAQGTWHARPDPPKTLDEIRRLTSLSVSIPPVPAETSTTATDPYIPPLLFSAPKIGNRSDGLSPYPMAHRTRR